MHRRGEEHEDTQKGEEAHGYAERKRSTRTCKRERESVRMLVQKEGELQ